MSETMRTIEVAAYVDITIKDREPIERVTGPNGDEWRAALYPLHTEADVLEHWAQVAVISGAVDVCQLDGWADVKAEVVTFAVST